MELSQRCAGAVVGFVDDHVDPAQLLEGLGDLIRLLLGDSRGIIAGHDMINHGGRDIAVFPLIIQCQDRIVHHAVVVSQPFARHGDPLPFKGVIVDGKDRVEITPRIN